MNGPKSFVGVTGPVGPGFMGSVGSKNLQGANGPVGPMGPVGPFGATGPTGPMGPSKVYWFLESGEMREAVGPKPDGITWILEEYQTRNLAILFQLDSSSYVQRIWLNHQDMLQDDDPKGILFEKYTEMYKHAPIDGKMSAFLVMVARDLKNNGWTIWPIMIS